MMMIDATDRELIGLLRENARLSTAQLARALGLARTTVQSRMEKLERNGIIAGYKVTLGQDYERGLVKAYVLITALPKLAPRVEAEVRQIAEVRTLHSVSGAFDLMAVVVAQSITELDALIDRIGHLSGVERTTTSVILSTRFDR